jgi:hypothetical protein
MKSFGIVLAVFLAGHAMSQEKPNTILIEPAPAQPGQHPQPQTPGVIKTADDLLIQLETADQDLRSLDADVRYSRVFGLEGDQQHRQGKLYYVDSQQRLESGKPAPGARKFSIHFTFLKLGNQPAMQQDQIMIFDGEWLIEKQPADKQIVKRQITRAGQGFDPLKVGEGPFPLPIGQRREDILQKFDAVLMPALQDLAATNPAEQKSLEEFVKGSHQLKLTPRQNDPNAELSEVRLWYRPDPTTGRLLPRLARTLTPQGDISLVQLVNVKVNQTVPADVLDTRTPAGWKEDVQALPAQPAPVAPPTTTRSPAPASTGTPQQDAPENRR